VTITTLSSEVETVFGAGATHAPCEWCRKYLSRSIGNGRDVERTEVARVEGWWRGCTRWMRWRFVAAVIFDVGRKFLSCWSIWRISDVLTELINKRPRSEMTTMNTMAALSSLTRSFTSTSLSFESVTDASHRSNDRRW